MRNKDFETRGAWLLSFVLASASVVSASAEGLAVSAETLMRADVPPMTALATNLAMGVDWTTCGTTETAGYSTELAHLDESGDLVLIDDAGFQHHAVWAASRPITTQNCWTACFRYEPNKSYKTGQTAAGGWTFVMQTSGPLAYSSSKVGKCSTAVLGAPNGSHGFLFHHYFGGLRWLENNATEGHTPFNWHYFKGTYGGGTHAEGLDIVMTDPIDFTFGCTANVWTVTMRQEGKQDVTLTHDFSSYIKAYGNGKAAHYLGLTGGSSYWGDKSWPMMYEKFTGITGTIGSIAPAFSPDGYALTNGNWATAGNAKFVDGKGLLIEEAVAGTRKYAAVCQNALYRDVPFEVDFRWHVETCLSGGAQGLSFSLVPEKVAKVCSNGTANYYYPGHAGSAGFSLRSYNTDGLTWHADGKVEAYGTRKTTIGWAGAYADVHIAYDGAKTLTVNFKNATGTTFEMSKTFENLPETFYPAFFGSTANWASGLEAYVRNFALRLPGNYTKEQEALVVSGEETFALASLNGDVRNAALHTPHLTLEAGSSLVVTKGDAAHGGTLAADTLVVKGASSVTTAGSCALLAGKVAFEALAPLALNGRFVAAEPVMDCVIDPAQIEGPNPVKLIDTQFAQVEGLTGGRLLDANGQVLGKDVARLVVRADGLYLKPKAGLTLILK